MSGTSSLAPLDPEDGSLLDYWRSRLALHTQDSYAGVPLSKFPEDLRVYEHLLWEAAPDTVLEIGTQFGASALWFRDRLRALAGYGRIGAPHVISLDIDQSRARAALDAADPTWSEQITLVEGDVRDEGTVRAVRAALRSDARCLVIEDGAHEHDTTLAALRSFADLVPVGGFLVVEDGCVDVEALRVSDDWPRGVLPALDEWLEQAGADLGFERERERELYGVTCHPHGFLRRVGVELEVELAVELERPPNWMYPWRLRDGREVPVLAPELPEIHRSRLEMIEPPVRRLLAERPGATVLDLACSEGWFAHRLLRWGADRVLGIDLREDNVRRAVLMRSHAGIEDERLEVRRGDLFELDIGALGTFDVVLLLGLIYHVEDPVGALRRARRLTADGGLCVIETQLTRQRTPIVHGWGRSDAFEDASASLAVRVEEDAAINPVASGQGVLSLVPNAAAFDAMVRIAGFSSVERRTAAPDHNPQYRRGDRVVSIARP